MFLKSTARNTHPPSQSFFFSSWLPQHPIRAKLPLESKLFSLLPELSPLQNTVKFRFYVFSLLCPSYQNPKQEVPISGAFPLSGLEEGASYKWTVFPLNATFATYTATTTIHWADDKGGAIKANNKVLMEKSCNIIRHDCVGVCECGKWVCHSGKVILLCSRTCGGKGRSKAHTTQ